MQTSVGVFFKQREKGCDGELDQRRIEEERVRMVEMGGQGCREDDDMRKRRGWRRGGVSAACFTCWSGNAALHCEATSFCRSSVANSECTYTPVCKCIHGGLYLHLAPQPQV